MSDTRPPIDHQGAWHAAPAARGAPAAHDAVHATPGRRPQLGDDVRPGLAPGKRSAMPVIAAAATVLTIAVVAIAFAALRGGGAAPVTPDSAPAARGTAPAATPSAIAPATASRPPAAATAPTPPHRSASAPKHAATKRAVAKPGSARPSATAAPAPGPVTRPGDSGTPNHATQVIRDIRQVEPAGSGPHTRDGSPRTPPIERGGKPKPATPQGPPGSAAHP